MNVEQQIMFDQKITGRNKKTNIVVKLLDEEILVKSYFITKYQK